MIDAEKALDKIHHLFTIKTLQKVLVVGNFTNMIKNSYETQLASHFIYDERLNALFPRLEGYLLLPLLSIVIDINTAKQEIKKKEHIGWKGINKIPTI